MTKAAMSTLFIFITALSLPDDIREQCPQGIYNYGAPLPGQRIPADGEYDDRIRDKWACVGTQKPVDFGGAQSGYSFRVRKQDAALQERETK